MKKLSLLIGSAIALIAVSLPATAMTNTVSIPPNPLNEGDKLFQVTMYVEGYVEGLFEEVVPLSYFVVRPHRDYNDCMLKSRTDLNIFEGNIQEMVMKEGFNFVFEKVITKCEELPITNSFHRDLYGKANP